MEKLHAQSVPIQKIIELSNAHYEACLNWESTMGNLVGADNIKSATDAIQLIKDQRDQAWRDDREIRGLIDADDNESTADGIRTHVALMEKIIGQEIVIRVAGEKIYSNVPSKFFDAGVIDNPNHEELEAKYNKSII